MKNRFAICAAALFLSGCAGLEKPKMPSVMAPQPEGKVGINYTLKNLTDDLAAYKDATSDKAKDLRDRMVWGILAEIDSVYYDYQSRLFIKEGNFHVAGDFVQLGLSGAATITNGARAKTVLSAVLTGATGLNLSLDKNYFRQQTVKAIQDSMDANRDRIKTEILQKLAKDNAGYPFSAARVDLVRYFYAGTLSAGLQQLGQDAANDAQKQKDALQKAGKALSGVTKDEVACVGRVNQAIAQAFTANSFGSVIAFLKAMNEPVADKAARADVETAVRSLGVKVSQSGDDQQRQDYCTQAKMAGLIQ